MSWLTIYVTRAGCVEKLPGGLVFDMYDAICAELELLCALLCLLSELLQVKTLNGHEDRQKALTVHVAHHDLVLAKLAEALLSYAGVAVATLLCLLQRFDVCWVAVLVTVLALHRVDS